VRVLPSGDVRISGGGSFDYWGEGIEGSVVSVTVYFDKVLVTPR
jgi:hypothetical protein